MKARREKPQSIVITGRVSDCSLANLHAFFESQGERINSMSDLMRMSVESLEEILIRNGLIKQFYETTRSAREYLMSQGLTTQGMKEKRSRNLFINQVNAECQAGIEAPLHNAPPSDELLHQINSIDVSKLEEELSQMGREKFCIQTDDEANLRDQLLGAIPSGLTSTEK